MTMSRAAEKKSRIAGRGGEIIGGGDPVSKREGSSRSCQVRRVNSCRKSVFRSQVSFGTAYPPPPLPSSEFIFLYSLASSARRRFHGLHCAESSSGGATIRIIGPPRATVSKLEPAAGPSKSRLQIRSRASMSTHVTLFGTQLSHKIAKPSWRRKKRHAQGSMKKFRIGD